MARIVAGAFLSAVLSQSHNEDLSRSEKELEVEHSRVTKILPNCSESDNQINVLRVAYRLVYGGPTDLLDRYSNLTEIETPVKNSVLHIAAWNGNDDIVTRLIDRAPKLLFTFNTNNDSVLHVAAKGGHMPTIKNLFAAYTNIHRHDVKMAWLEYTQNLDKLENYDEKFNMENLLDFVKLKNVQGNTVLHEAILCDQSYNIGKGIFEVCELYKTEDQFKNSLSNCCYEYALDIVNNEEQSVLYIAVENGDKDTVELILENSSYDRPNGLSPVVAAIMKRDLGMLRIILQKKPTWIHLIDTDERLPLHYASFIGYYGAVFHLLHICNCCTIQRDKEGYFPIHLASRGGHVKVVSKLLNYCPDPTEMLDIYGRNILHIASNYGKHEVVCYILQSYQVRKLDKKDKMINQKDNEGNTPLQKKDKMINQKDNEGNTPLHLAAKSFHPKTVFYLTWDTRVHYDLINQNNQTALDVVNEIPQLGHLSARQQLTRTALNSAGAKTSSKRAGLDKSRQSDSNSSKLEQSNESGSKANETSKIVSNTAQYFFLAGSDLQYKDRVETLILVSTLIITASVAACFAVPGEAEGRAHNLYHAMFQFFIFFITISLFSSISATIILFWATLGLSQLVTSSLKIVMPLLGIALISLTLAFMAGLYTVISPLRWLANLFLVVAVIFVVLVILLYIVLFLPSASTRKTMRYISYYPFLFLAWLAE